MCGGWLYCPEGARPSCGIATNMEAPCNPLDYRKLDFYSVQAMKNLEDSLISSITVVISDMINGHMVLGR